MVTELKDKWYVFFVKTGKEDNAAEDIRRVLSAEEAMPVECSVETLFKKRGRVIKESRPLFPGYMFVRSKMDDEEFGLMTRKCIRESENIIKLLKYDDSGLASIRAEEKMLLEAVLQGDNTIKSSLGYLQGDRVIISEGPLKGRESVIKSINRHKMQAVIEIQIMGELRKVVVGLEIIARNNRQ